MESPDELHDALLTLGMLPDHEVVSHRTLLRQLQKENRVVQFLLEAANPDSESSRSDLCGRGQVPNEMPTRQGQASGSRSVYWAARERALLLQTVYPEAYFEPKMGVTKISQVALSRDEDLDFRQATIELLRCRLECTGPVTIMELAALYNLPEHQVETALLGLEAEGQVLRGNFRPSTEEMEWCDRRLLDRIHRLTLGQIRREIEPVPATGFLRFLCRWQQVEPGTQLHGEAGLALVLDQLQGYEAPAAAWEGFLLPARVTDYKPKLLDRLCLSCRFLWGRINPPGFEFRRRRSSRSPP